MGVQVDDASADDVMAQLLVLESQDPDRDIVMYINSPGGSFTAMTAIYDTMQYVRPEIQTVVLGQAASAAAVRSATLVRCHVARSSRFLACPRTRQELRTPGPPREPRRRVPRRGRRTGCRHGRTHRW
ncbi:MAG: ATP-dependent Clp protease proteolytic subunit [Nitriliruptoraceae bacterium]